MQTVDLPCPWCLRKVVCVQGAKNTCPVCGHRADVTAPECDCVVCRVRNQQHARDGVLPAVATGRAIGKGFRVGRLVVAVNGAGVNRILIDCEDADVSIEFFESTARAIEVFKHVWELLTIDQKAKLLTELGVTRMG
jgi:hypothetical protein